MEERFVESGLTVFLVGAGMHLAILQELAFVDPKVASPSGSHYAKSVQDYAKKYSYHAKATFPKTVEARLNLIQPKSDTQVSPRSGATISFFWFVDKFNGYEGGHYRMNIDFKVHDKHTEQKRNEAMEKYREDQKKVFVAKMEDPVETADEWLELETQPLPNK